MTSKQELERKRPSEIAALCQRVADNPAAYLAAAADEAGKLKLEWDKLDSQRNPNYAVQRKTEEQKFHMQRRMILFLTETL